MKSNDNDEPTINNNETNLINSNAFNENGNAHNEEKANQMNTLNFNSTITPMPNSIELLDDIMKARDELFEKQLGDGLKAHRKLAGLLQIK